jgi:hypothetical protein
MDSMRGGGAMRKVIVSEFLTPGWVMQAPGDSDEDRREGFEHGGWQMPTSTRLPGAPSPRG